MIESARTHYIDALRSVEASLKTEGREIHPEVRMELERFEVSNPVYGLTVVDFLERLPGALWEPWSATSIQLRLGAMRGRSQSRSLGTALSFGVSHPFSTKPIS